MALRKVWSVTNTFINPYLCTSDSHHNYPRPASCRQRGIQQPQSIQGLRSVPSSELICNSWGSWLHLHAPWNLADTTLIRSFQSLQKYLKVSNPSKGGITSLVYISLENPILATGNSQEWHFGNKSNLFNDENTVYTKELLHNTPQNFFPSRTGTIR